MGDGPLNGGSKMLHTILLADDPVAADSILTRLLGADLNRISLIREAGRFLGNINDSAISRLS